MDVDITDDVMRLYIQHFIMNRSQEINVPGFVFFKLPNKTAIKVRQVVVPEDFFVNFEKAMAAKGKKAQAALYSVGKRFGYGFALLGEFSSIKDKSGRQLVEYINVINKFIEGTYATRIECKVNLDTKSATYFMEKPIVIEKLGYGYFLPLAAAAGLMAYLFQDPTIEGIQENFDTETGKGMLHYAPANSLMASGKEFFEEHNLSELEINADYTKLNSAKVLNHSNYSLRTLLDSKFFALNNGFLLNGHERYFILEVSALYLIEKDLKDYSEDIYNAAFTSGIRILNAVKAPSLKTITDYLSAFGWGDILITAQGNGYRAGVSYFPYNGLYKEASFLIFSGFLAGMLTTVFGKTIRFSKIESNVMRGYLELLLS